MSVDKKEQQVIEDEQRLLRKVVSHLSVAERSIKSFTDYDEELMALRDAIAEALPEDVPSLVEQMTRLQAIAAQRGQGADLPVDPKSPYFGHLRLLEKGKRRDVLLGKRTYISPNDGIRVVDWRNAPVSRMYYCYDEGDEYDEIFGGRLRSGVVESRRSVTITDSRLRRIDCPLGTLVYRNEEWIKLHDSGAKLAGGQGSAIRGGGKKRFGKLGVDNRGMERQDRHLPEISALLDKEQFALISADDGGVMVVQGSAGSGKTTVGLHRVAYLVYQRRRPISSANSVVLVKNNALVNYIKDVLPALGVFGVQVMTFERWCAGLRTRHVKGLPTKYAENTPQIVSRVKKHPALLRILADIVDQLDEEVTRAIDQLAERFNDGDRIKKAWRAIGRMPLDARRKRFLRWLDGEVRIGRDHGDHLSNATCIAVDSLLARYEPRIKDVIGDWADLFTDREALIHAFDTHAPAEFSKEELDRVCDWCKAQYRCIFEAMEGADGGDGMVDDDEPPCLDREDDVILIRLHQLKKGWLRRGGKRLEYHHMMIDEVQDFSALEVRSLIETVGQGFPITLCGDTAQKIVQEGGFDDWETFFDDLGLDGVRVEPLKIAYRSTAEVMAVARSVLGHLAGDESVAVRHGAPVEVHQFSDPGQAVDFLSGALRELHLREPLASVAVVARHRAQAKLYHDGLQKAELSGLRLVLAQDFTFKPGIDVTEVRQVKGLEFDYVIVVECNDDSYPENDEARHLLHVAMTRAAHQLWMITTSTPSPLLPKELL